MEQNGQPANQPVSQPVNKMKGMLVPFIIIGVLLVVVCVLLFQNLQASKPQESVSFAEGETPKLAYAENVTVVADPEELQKAVDEMYANMGKGGISLEYKNAATSSDGETFNCYMANAAKNVYDMYIDIYADLEMTDEIFLSGLLRPGTAFDKIKLNRPLDEGTHQVYVAFTQVEEDLATLHDQFVVTMDFTVTK